MDVDVELAPTPSVCRCTVAAAFGTPNVRQGRAGLGWARLACLRRDDLPWSHSFSDACPRRTSPLGLVSSLYLLTPAPPPHRFPSLFLSLLALAVLHRLLRRARACVHQSLRKMTPLMVSVALGDATMMKTLLRFGADACHAGIGDLTPLHIAAGKCFDRQRACGFFRGRVGGVFGGRRTMRREYSKVFCPCFVVHLIIGHAALLCRDGNVKLSLESPVETEFEPHFGSLQSVWRRKTHDAPPSPGQCLFSVIVPKRGVSQHPL